MKQSTLLIAICILFISCKENQFKTGTVKFLGDLAVDSCGWLIDIHGTTYKPLQLDSTYMIDQLSIEVRYEISDSKANCGFAIDLYSEIEILEIK